MGSTRFVSVRMMVPPPFQLLFRAKTIAAAAFCNLAIEKTLGLMYIVWPRKKRSNIAWQEQLN